VDAVVHDDAIDVSSRPDDSVEVIDTPARASDAVDAPAAENKGATDAVDANAATSPSAPEPMNKILQSIWDASAVATASRGDLRFMPFSNELDPSKLAELRTLQGHSGSVRRAASAFCTTFVICLCCRSWALRCFRTGGASFLGRGTRRSSSGGYPELLSRGEVRDPPPSRKF